MKTKLLLLLFLMNGWLILTGKPIGKKEIPQKVYTTKAIKNNPPVIDGKGNDPVWEQVEWAGDFIQREPHENAAPTQKTAFKILYDNNNVYVLIRAYDTEADKIVTRMARRDDQQGDFVTIFFDSYYDKLSAFSFTVSAAGVKTDAIMSNDGNNDLTWDPVWFAKTSIDKDGWTAEMRIPLDQLRFSGQKEHVWGLEVARQLSRIQESSVWKQVPKDASGTVYLFGELKGINGIKPKRQQDVMPYMVAKTESYKTEVGNPYSKGHENNLGVGVDGKMGITNDFTLDFTINPDFGQVEADPSQVNLTGFETYFKEQRPFFIEGRDVMNFQLTMGNNPYSGDNLFYSRRIGRQPHYSPDGDYVKDPQNTRILGAFKLTGKTKDGLSLGIMESVTDRMYSMTTTNDKEDKVESEPYTNYLVGSVMQDYNKGNTRFGGVITATNRDLSNPLLKDKLPGSAYTGGLRFEHNWKDRKYTLQVLAEFSEVNGTAPAMKLVQESSVHYFQRPDASYVKYDTTRTSLLGHGGSINFMKMGSGHFRYLFWLNWRSPGLELNDVGFIRKADDIFQVAWLSYKLWEPTSIYRQLNIESNQWTDWDFGGRNTFKGGNIGINSQLKNYWWANLYMGIDGSNIDNSILRGGPSLKLPGGYNINYSVSSDDRKKFVYGFFNAFSFGFNNVSQSIDYGVDLSYRPIDAIKITLSPGFETAYNNMQYVDKVSGRYIVARIDQRMFRSSFRFEYYPRPNMSVQYYGQPFIFAGNYSDFKKVTNSMASNYSDRIHIYDNNEIQLVNDSYTVKENGNTNKQFSFDNPNFKSFAFLSNLVFRWEYVPGSTVYLVWSQNRGGSDKVANFNFGKDFSNIYQIYPQDVFMIKFSYRF
ncbi:MAG: carbohydrate binding family 9 domain-containing protein [Bacteroidetes bacterium]|nr:carbohydrate binding family 9 domain-containing protein [Bacteroidota bacterium]